VGDLEQKFAGILELGVYGILDFGVCGILEWGVCGILEKIMSVHNNKAEDSSMSGSWGHRRARTGGSREGNTQEGRSNRKGCNNYVQEHLEI